MEDIEFDYTGAYATVAPTAIFTREPKSMVHLAFHVDIILVIAGIAFMVLIRVWLEYINRDSVDRSYLNYEGPSDDEKTGIQKLLVEDWVFLYNKTFHSNPNRLILRKEHVANIKSEDSEYIGNDMDVEESISIAEESIEKEDVQDIESGRAGYKTKQEGSCLSSSYSMLLDFAGRLHVPSTDATPKNMPPICEACVICFEEFRAGDEVVWSATNTTTITDSENAATKDEDEIQKQNHSNHCQHVYHQACMVQYLANHSHRKFQKQSHFEGGLDVETPCPTCRRNFCILSDEDISAAIKTRCQFVAETSSSSGDDESNENGSGETNDPESQEEGTSTDDATGS